MAEPDQAVDIVRVLRQQQHALRLLVAEREAVLGMSKDEVDVALNKKRVWRAREALDEADRLLGE